MEPEKLEKIAQDMGFDLLSKSSESDEYFTDINNEYIKNRTCLRIRKVNNKFMEITYKGKSTSFLSQYCKLENNITADIKELKELIEKFNILERKGNVGAGTVYVIK
jgi:adenylate cyclase class IV